MIALNFVEPRDAEQYAPVTMQDLVLALGPIYRAAGLVGHRAPPAMYHALGELSKVESAGAKAVAATVRQTLKQ